MTVPGWTPAASMRVGVAGPNAAACRLAMVFRDYGRHRVLGFGLNPHLLYGSDAVRWVEQDVAEAPTSQHLARLSDLIFVTDPTWAATIARGCDAEGVYPPLVIASICPRLHLRLVAIRLRGRNPLAYSPVDANAEMDALASPEQIWVASQHAETHELVQRVWSAVINAVPVVHVGFSRVSETGLLLPPVASTAPAPIDITPLPESPTEEP